MNYRWTMQDLKESTDEQITLQCVRDRYSCCTNYYTPLAERLKRIINKLEKLESRSK